MIQKKSIRLFAKNITGELVKDRQEVVINWRAVQLVLEPIFKGGKDSGPDPFTAVLSGLIGRTLTTLRLYKKKGWHITDIHYSVKYFSRQSYLALPFSELFHLVNL